MSVRQSLPETMKIYIKEMGVYAHVLVTKATQSTQKHLIASFLFHVLQVALVPIHTYELAFTNFCIRNFAVDNELFVTIYIIIVYIVYIYTIYY